MLWAAGCIVLLVGLVSGLGLHPFLALLAVSVVLGLGGGLPFGQTITEFERGFGDVMGHVGIVVGLGTMLGTLLVRSGGADTLAGAFARSGGVRTVPYKLFLASLLIGLPLFFEVGFVLLVPLAFALARQMNVSTVRIGLPMLAGLSVAHALTPPHPAPTLAVASLHADVGRTILWALALGLPLGLLAGPVFASLAARWVRTAAVPVPVATATVTTTEPADAVAATEPATGQPPSVGATLFCVLLPVVLMMSRSLVEAVTAGGSPLRGVFGLLGDPVAALFFAVLAGAVLLGRPRSGGHTTFRELNAALGEGLGAIAAILLIVGAGGGLKQMLIATKVAATLGNWAASVGLSPLVLGWLAAALVRIATGSATVATITAVGIMTPIAAANPTVHRELLVLAIGSGSVILSHVNDAGFWLVKEYFGLSVADTFKTWTLMETLIAVGGLALVLAVNAIL